MIVKGLIEFKNMLLIKVVVWLVILVGCRGGGWKNKELRVLMKLLENWLELRRLILKLFIIKVYFFWKWICLVVFFLDCYLDVCK